MDLIAKHKKTGAVNRMSEQVFAMNGGTDVYDIIDYEGSDTFSERSKSQTEGQPVETAESFEERMQKASRAAGVIIASSTVVEEPGKLEAVAAAANSPFSALPLEGPSTSAPTPLQPGVKAISLADLQTGVGSTMFPNDASPEATRSARESQTPANQDQPQSTVTHNVLKVDDNGTATVEPQNGAETPQSQPKAENESKAAPQADKGEKKAKANGK